MINLPNPITVIPKYRAIGAQTAAHSTNGAQALAHAVKPSTPNVERLQALTRAATGFDHAISDSQKFPFTRGLNKYYKGYEAARVGLLVAVGSGVIPGARELVGKEQMTISQEQFHTGVNAFSADNSRYSRFRAADWLSHATSDAASGLAMLRKPALAIPLLGGLKRVEAAISSNKPVSPDAVKSINELFGKATVAFDALVGAKRAAYANAIRTGQPLPKPAQLELPFNRPSPFAAAPTAR